MEDFTRVVIRIILSIPRGKVSTYGRIGAMAGKPNGARQVVRILHSMSRKYDLPWHRVVNARGRISLRRYEGYERQKACLLAEGIIFDDNDRIDFGKHLWNGE